MGGTKPVRRSVKDSGSDPKQMEMIQAVQNKLDNINATAAEEIIKVEVYFTKQRKSHLEARTKLLSKVPNFWLTVFQNHPQFSTVIAEFEIGCLEHLINLEVDENEKLGSGYRLKFYFEENSYFENDLIVKELSLQLRTGPESKTTPIKWKEGNKLYRQVKRSDPSRSFFSWLLDTSDPENDELAEMIKEEIWTNPLEFWNLSNENDNDGDDDGSPEQGSSKMDKDGAEQEDADDVEIVDEEELDEEDMEEEYEEIEEEACDEGDVEDVGEEIEDITVLTDKESEENEK